MNVGSRKVHGPRDGQTLREWAEKEVVEGQTAKTMKALKIRPESWKERTVAGAPALSVVGDFEEGKEKKVGYAVFTAGKTNSAVLTLIAPAKEFEVCQPQFEALVNSYQEQ